MNRVHDLSGDWFALPPDVDFTRWGFAVEDLVDTVLASTRTAAVGKWGDFDPERWYPPVEVWADPPFVRVAAIAPIVPPGPCGPPFSPCVEFWPDSWDPETADSLGKPRTVLWGDDDQEVEIDIDIPAAQPGGWAVRVEPADNVVAWAGNIPTGRPLNEQTTTAEGAA